MAEGTGATDGPAFGRSGEPALLRCHRTPPAAVSVPAQTRPLPAAAAGCRGRLPRLAAVVGSASGGWGVPSARLSKGGSQSSRASNGGGAAHCGPNKTAAAALRQQEVGKVLGPELGPA